MLPEPVEACCCDALGNSAPLDPLFKLFGFFYSSVSISNSSIFHLFSLPTNPLTFVQTLPITFVPLSLLYLDGAQSLSVVNVL